MKKKGVEKAEMGGNKLTQKDQRIRAGGAKPGLLKNWCCIEILDRTFYSH